MARGVQGNSGMQGGWQPPPGGSGGYGGPPGYGPQADPYGSGATTPAGPNPTTPTNPYGSPGAGPFPPAMPPMAESYGHYEFNALENSIIDKTARRAKLWGTISLVVGVLQVLSSCAAVANPGLASQFPSGVIAIVVGIAFMGVGTSLKNVVQTQGNDVGHMMHAMEKLGNAFMVQIVCTIVGIVLIALFLAVLLVFFAASVAQSNAT